VVSGTSGTRSSQWTYVGRNVYREGSRFYVHGSGVDEPLGLIVGYGVQQNWYYVAEGLGSVRLLVDEAGNPVNRYRYSAFGKMRQAEEGVSNSYTYTAREWDADAGLYYYRARWYDPAVGRFMSEDPIGFAGGDANFYRYVLNDPGNFVDPFGLFRWYGNWGGPNWTGGQVGTWDTIDRSKAKLPTDEQDKCYMMHDICYGNCRGNPCPGCRKDCDRELADCLRRLGKDPSNNWKAKAAARYFEKSNPVDSTTDQVLDDSPLVF